MGGKGGGGQMQDTGLSAKMDEWIDQDPETGLLIFTRDNTVHKSLHSPSLGTKDEYFAYRNKPKEEEKPVEAVVEAVKEEPVKEATPLETAAATPDTTLPVPDTGDTLGGAVLDPPSYLVGGIEDYNKAKNTKGSMTTTQT